MGKQLLSKVKNVILINQTIPEFFTVLLWFNGQNYCNHKPKLNYSTTVACLDKNDTYVMSYSILFVLEYKKKIRRNLFCNLPSQRD